jgi:putative ABC transport system permease protein
MLGIFIGIAAVVSLVAISQGLKDSIQAQFDKIGADKLYISVKNTNFGVGSDISSVKLTTEDLDRVKKSQNVKTAIAYNIKAATVTVGFENGVHYLIDIPDTADERELAIALNSLEVTTGKMMRKNDPDQVVIGAELAKPGLYSKTLGVGTKILVNGRQFQVAGIWKKVGDPGTDSSVFMSQKTLRELINEPKLVTVIVAQSAKGANPLTVAETVKKNLRSFRNVKEGDEDFEVQTPDDILRSLNTVLDIIQVVLVGVAVISLVVGGIGIMNTMYTATLERTTEIGVMKAIGARNSDIMVQFLVEAGFLGMAGGIIGVALGAGIAYLVQIIASFYLGSNLLHVYFPWYLIVGALTFAFVVGSLSGALPAWQASKLPPVEALRYE